MAWIASHQSLSKHPKLLRLAARMHITAPQVVSHLHYLWWWTLEYAPGGDLSRFNAQEIAIASEWTGDPNLWMAALQACGWIDPDGQLHDWDEHGGKLAAERTKERERKRAERARAKADIRSPPKTERPEDVQGTSGGHPALHYTTSENPKGEVERENFVSAVADPGRFPRTAAEAAHEGPPDAPAGFAEKLWHLAASRGWRDARDIPIRNWSSYLAASLAFAKEAELRRRKPAPTSGCVPQRVPADARLLKEVIHAPVIKA